MENSTQESTVKSASNEKGNEIDSDQLQHTPAAHAHDENDALDSAQDTVIEIDGVIKPKKLQLPGLTIKGKIDLSSPKKTSPDSPASESKVYDPNKVITTQGPQRKRCPKRAKKKGDPIEAERKRKVSEEKKEQRKIERKKRMAKSNYYKANVTMTASPKRKKKRKQEVTPSERVVRNIEKNNANPLQRLWRWFNS